MLLLGEIIVAVIHALDKFRLPVDVDVVCAVFNAQTYYNFPPFAIGADTVYDNTT